MNKLIKPKKITSYSELYMKMPENECIMMEALRYCCIESGKGYLKEKLSFQVPFFYHHKGICILWPATIKGGGIKSGVLFGIWHGYLLRETQYLLTRGSNKKVLYQVYHEINAIDFDSISACLTEAIEIDKKF